MRVKRMARSIKCLMGMHQYQRSRFVALNSRTANLVCVHCHKVVEQD